MLVENINTMDNIFLKRKKRSFNEMISTSTLETESHMNMDELRETFEYYPSKKKKFDNFSNSETIKQIRNTELLIQLSHDLQQLQLNQIKPEHSISKIDKDDFNDSIIESETSNTSFSFEDISFINRDKIISDKIITNALQTEKTMIKLFDTFNPSLQPNENNAICLYKDMKKEKQKLINTIYIKSLFNNAYKNSNEELNITDINNYMIID